MCVYVCQAFKVKEGALARFYFVALFVGFGSSMRSGLHEALFFSFLFRWCCASTKQGECDRTHNTLQHTATHCITLQHIATCYIILQRTAPPYNTLQHAATRRNTLQHTATHCNTLQCVAVCCTLQHTATHCSVLQLLLCAAVCCRALQRVVVWCRLLHCNTLQHTATHCNTLQHRMRRYEALCACMCVSIFQYVCVFGRGGGSHA